LSRSTTATLICARGWCSIVGCHVAVGNAQFAQHAAQNEGGQSVHQGGNPAPHSGRNQVNAHDGQHCGGMRAHIGSLQSTVRHMVMTAEDVAKLLEETDKAFKQEQDPSSSSSSSSASASASISATPINSSSSENQPKSSHSVSDYGATSPGN
jgi:hypothetical protein